MKPLVVASNMFNEIHQLQGDDWLSNWYVNMCNIADMGILIVDTGSTDGTIEYFKGKQNVTVVVDDIILREGYGPARNHLRDMSKKHYPDAQWVVYLDGDERINPSDYHRFRFMKDYLDDRFDIIAFPRKNMVQKGRLKTKRDIHVNPDYQARMSRLYAPIKYVNRLHESVEGARGIFADIKNPKIEHYHRSTNKEKRDYIGKVCVHLWQKQNEENPGSLPKHHKQHIYEELLDKEGLVHN